MTQEMETAPTNTTLYLTAESKSVDLLFDDKGYLQEITVNVNKFVELVGNKTFTEHSILEVDEIVLLTMSNHKTYVPVKAKEGTSLDTDPWNVKKIYQSGGFAFVVHPAARIHMCQLKYRQQKPKK